jgi:hypothetical protein
VRTRLYFTSESHLHTLLNVLRYPNDGITLIPEEGVMILDSLSELSYMTQIVIRLFETVNEGAPSVFRCEISFTPGAISDPVIDKSPALYPYVTISKSTHGSDVVRVLADAIVKLQELQPSPELPVDAATTTDTPARGHKRFNETVVLSNAIYDIPDTWEDGLLDSPARRGTRRINSRRSVSFSSKSKIPLPHQRSLDDLPQMGLTSSRSSLVESQLASASRTSSRSSVNDAPSQQSMRENVNQTLG